VPNLVNEILLDDLKQSFRDMGSCLVVSFDRLTVEQAHDIRGKFRDAGMRLQVVKNRLAVKAFADLSYDLSAAFKGKCGVVVAPEEGAIAAAKLVREATEKLKEPPLTVRGAIIEGEVIVGHAAATIADMPDKNTVRAQLCGAILGVGRGLAVAMQAAGPAGLARATQARVDKQPA
jgi:large subunit ribosomal protein L10